MTPHTLTAHALATFTTGQLQAAYAALTGRRTVNRNKKGLLRSCANLLAAAKLAQPKALLPARAASSEAPATTPAPKAKAPIAKVLKHDHSIIPPVGSVLMHTYRDRPPTIAVVLDNGLFAYNDQIYDNLGAIAKAASGQTWNGKMFFRLVPYPKHGANPRTTH